MAQPPHDARSPASLYDPKAPGWCDRCYRKWYLDDLHWQFDWRGNSLQNLRIRVCPECMDVPQEQFRPILIPPDPIPVKDPRPNFYQAEAQGGVPLPNSVQEILDD